MSFVFHNFDPIRPILIFFPSVSKVNFGFILLDLHFRILLSALIFFAIFMYIPSKLEKCLQNIPYKEPSSIGCIDKILCCIFRIKLNEEQSSQYTQDKKNEFKWLTFFREAFYHPWSLLTQANEWREVLMVDIMTKDGNLYSGAFRTWTPEGDSISSVTMEYALRYSPKEPKEDREETLIRNNGEMIFLSSEVKHIHFWELRRNHKTTVVVKCPADTEIFKWNLLLSYIYPDFLTEISVHINLKEQEFEQFREQVIDWIKSNRVILDWNKVKFVIPIKK